MTSNIYVVVIVLSSTIMVMTMHGNYKTAAEHLPKTSYFIYAWYIVFP